MKSFSFNGYHYKINSDITLFELINYFNYNHSIFIVEYNNILSPNHKWKKICIKNNDKIELITIVGGG